jgi:hypothetical protein
MGNVRPKAFTVVLTAILVGILALVIAEFGTTQLKLSTYGSWLQEALWIYLAFIFFRTSCHLLLSFANAFFAEGLPASPRRPLVSIIVLYSRPTPARRRRSIAEFLRRWANSFFVWTQTVFWRQMFCSKDSCTSSATQK